MYFGGRVTGWGACRREDLGTVPNGKYTVLPRFSREQRTMHMQANEQLLERGVVVYVLVKVSVSIVQGSLIRSEWEIAL